MWGTYFPFWGNGPTILQGWSWVWRQWPHYPTGLELGLEAMAPLSYRAGAGSGGNGLTILRGWSWVWRQWPHYPTGMELGRNSCTPISGFWCPSPLTNSHLSENSQQILPRQTGNVAVEKPISLGSGSTSFWLPTQITTPRFQGVSKTLKSFITEGKSSNRFLDQRCNISDSLIWCIRSKRYVLRCLLKVAIEVPEWTDSRRLFQREGVQELKALAPVMVLILGTNRVIPLFDLSERDGREVAIKEWR